jgi:NAD(P)-dependent dehydrogenase (short-subunit alcohol dehydrogenase family)
MDKVKTYVLTGGASGIGAAIKSALVEAGHKVLVIDLHNADIEADLSSSDGRVAAINAVRAVANEGLDGFVACAGVPSHAKDLGLILGVNYLGATELTGGLRPLLARKGGAVLLISSNSAPMETNDAFVDALLADDINAATGMLSDMEGQAVYSGTKQALARWMRHNTAAYAADGIRMNALAPGYTETPMTAAVAQSEQYADAIRQFLASIPMKRAGEPADMANAARFLLSDEASFICGSVLFVDGGHDAMFRPDAF